MKTTSKVGINCNNSIITTLLVFIFACLAPVYAYSQNPEEVTEKQGLQYFNILDKDNRFVDNLLSALSSDENAYNLPLGIKKIIGNNTYTLAVSSIKIGNTYGEMTLFLKIDNIYKSKTLIFGASGIKISYTGDIIGDVKLALLSDIPINLGSMGILTLKGSMDKKTGESTSGTYLQIKCNGDFKEMSLNGELTLNENTFKTPGNGGPVKAEIHTVISDFTDLLLELSLPAFEIKSIPDFQFKLENVALDLSDKKNPSVFNPKEGYFEKNFTLPDRNLWRGIYAKDITVTFPSMFNKKGSDEKTKITAHDLLIDENGITGEILGDNILPFESGDASGCRFSVTDFVLGFETNNIYKFGFGGKIDIPMTEDSEPLQYKAYIAKDEYLFNVTLGQKMQFNLFGAGELALEKTSFMQIEVNHGKFVPKVILDGEMVLNAGGLSIGQLAFRKLSLSAKAPIFSVESVVCGGNLSINNFPISINNFNFSAKDDIASLGFEMKVNLMQGAISAGSSVKLSSQYAENKWHFKGVSIERMVLDKVQLSGFSLAGEINLVKNDVNYGDYFGGDITATFGALSDALSVNVKAIFGQKGFRYWYVEGQVNFSQGIPAGFIILDGFTGGAYYHMSPTGQSGLRAYAPDEKCSLGVKAGVSFHIGTKQAVNGNVLFEMNFLSTGGIGSIMFYGSAKFMDVSGLLGDKYAQYFKDAQNKSKDLGKSYASDLPGGLDGSDAAKNILPNMDLSGAIAASLSIKYEFTTKTFDANFKVMVNLLGILRGVGDNNEAGWVSMHCDPRTWYIHAGTPSKPMGLKLGLGSFSLTSKSYFMLGDNLEKPILDPNVARILKITPEQADYMKLPENMSLGKGVAFGSSFSFDTGNLQFLILYARFMAGAGFDVMLSDMGAYRCEGSNDPIGINGWYANGQSYVYLQGELGVRIKILTIKKNITIIKGAAAALLQAKLPNPTWIGGYMAVELNVLGIIKANMKMKFSFGQDCKFVSADGNDTPLDFPIIADVSPADKDKDVDVFLSPQATFNMAPEEVFDAQDDDGNTKTYRIRLTDFYLTDNKGAKISGNIKQNKTVVTFEPFDILPPNVDIKLTVTVGLEEKVNGSWRVVTENGKAAGETRTLSFTTGSAPNYIPVSNIQYCYPVIGQKNFFKGESAAGYVQLKKGQGYLFPPNFSYKAIFEVANEKKEVKFNYNSSEKRLDYTFPTLNNRMDYMLSFVAYTAESSQQGNSQIKQSVSISDGDESFSVDYMQQAAQKIIKEGSLKVLDYTLRTSGYNTLSEKLSSLSFTRGAIMVDADVRLLFLRTGAHELFDEIDLEGSIYNDGKPLVEIQAILDDPYYLEDIAPLTYHLLSISGMSIQNRDPNIAGAPPVRGFSILDGYFMGNPDATKAFPLVYQLVYYYNKDYLELRNKAANLLLNPANHNPSLLNLISKQFPYIRKGENYKTQIKYVLPGNKQGTTKQLNYIFTNEQ